MKLFDKHWWATQLYKENLLKSDEVHDLIPGGLSKGKTINDIVNKYKTTLDIVKTQLKKGIKIELEHTTSKKIALEIAMDHLWEDLQYYNKLKKVEVNELGINKGITVKEAQNYYLNNIWEGDLDIDLINKYKILCKPYLDEANTISFVGFDSFINLSQQSLNKLYQGMKALVQKHSEINELGINPNINPKTVEQYYIDNFWNVDDDNRWHALMDFSKFNLVSKYNLKYHHPDSSEDFEKFSQQDLNKLYKGMKALVQKHSQLNELGINSNRIKFPLIIKNQNEYNKLAPILDKQGYVFYSGVKATEWWDEHHPPKKFPMYLELEGNLMFTPMDMLYESPQQNNQQIFEEFINFCLSKLEISEQKPKIILTKDKGKTTTFAHYDPNNKEIVVYIKDRNILDVCRSLAHELKHWEQDIKGILNPNSGKTGSPEENEANSFAGIVLRDFGKQHSELYTYLVENKQINELGINKPSKTWDLNKQGVKYEKIKPGDIIEFNLYDTNPPTLVKQKVVKINGVSQLSTHDLGNEKAIDFWHVSDIENYWKKNVGDLNEKIDIYKEDEIFSAYHGKYKFDISKAYKLINDNEIKYKIITYQPEIMHFLSHPEFSEADPEKYNEMEIDYNKPLGLIANFNDPELNKTELLLIDGNNRTRKAVEDNHEGKYVVIYDPNDVSKILTIDNNITKKLFSDED